MQLLGTRGQSVQHGRDRSYRWGLGDPTVIRLRVPKVT